jgi:hypothetical protein
MNYSASAASNIYLAPIGIACARRSFSFVVENGSIADILLVFSELSCSKCTTVTVRDALDLIYYRGFLCDLTY